MATSDLAATANAVRPQGSRGREITVGRIAFVLILLQLLVRGWSCVRGYFYLDDFSFMGRAMHYNPVDPAYLMYPYNSHVMPGAYIWVWLSTHAFPLSWPPVALAMLVLQTILAIATYRLLVELFGRRPLILVALAVALFSPVSLPASLWWAAALNQLPQQLAIVVGLLAFVRYLRHGRRWHLVAGPVALVGGLLFSEKTLFLLPLLVGLTLAFFTSGSLWQRLRQTVRLHWRVWVLYAVVALPYLAYYVTSVPSPLRQTATGHDVADLATQSFFRATLPGLFGGPWTWSKIGFAGALADPSPFLVALALILGTAVVTVTVVWWRGAGLAWLVFLGYAAVNLALLARSRATIIGPIIGTEYRYQSDLALIAALALAFATMQVRGRFTLAHPTLLEPRASSREWLSASLGRVIRDAAVDSSSPAPVPAKGGRRRRPRERLGLTPELRSGRGLAALTATAALTASALWSTAAYDPLWVDNPARGYLATAQVELKALPPGAAIADAPVPTQVAWALIYPYNMTANMFAPILPPNRRLTPGHGSGEALVPDESGHLRTVLVVGPSARPGPVAGCGWQLGAGADIPLTAKATDAVVLIRVGYLATAETVLVLRAGDTTVRLPIKAGLGSSFAAVPGPITSLHVTGVGDNVRVCSDDIMAGAPVAVPGTTP